jgi:glycosyltransferase involved in cell wall biosynthesis
MKILVFSTLYPNAERPNHGIFVEARLKKLLASGQVEVQVVAPVPWFPFRHPRFGQYAVFARTPKQETRAGIAIHHPSYPLLPKIGMSIAPFLLVMGAIPTLRRLRAKGYDFDLIDAHYFYPDGVAAVLLGRYFNKPVVITSRGTDISFIPQFTLPRRLIQWAARRADGLIAVCDALRNALIRLNISPDRITTLRNGVDLKLFHPINREAQRAHFGWTGFTLLSVGNLIPVKGHDLVITALAQLPDVTLVIAGGGAELANLKALAQRLKVSERVVLVGVLPQDELVKYYGAADALVLASSREGWANVLLESMACGTPVIASRVWGTPEVVASEEAGLLMPERTAACVVTCVRQLQKNYPDRAATRRYAEGFDWADTTAGQLRLFRSVLKCRKERAEHA